MTDTEAALRGIDAELERLAGELTARARDKEARRVNVARQQIRTVLQMISPD